ncbi:MAG: 2Fe-2S iron-sulfur cluster binding domain-containing protein [Actinobacteria bacterium]|nr:2Fe-2S iron-sulfur cluster binding domain-containing protein [Actinomycetota bacterium]
MESTIKHEESAKSAVINKNINLFIDNKAVPAGSGDTLLLAARKAGIHIPALCYHEKIKPHGACRLCIVEIVKKGKSRIVASCAYPAEEGLQVFTESLKITEIRKHLVELYMALFPYNEEIKALAKKYGLKETRYHKENNYCILCGLCVRYCAEVKKENAIGFIGRGTSKKVAFIPDSSYFKYCVNCMECMDICPTGVFPSNYGIERLPQTSDF